MLVTTTTSVEGRRVREYRGLVMGEAILGANVFRDFFASVRDVVGGLRDLGPPDLLGHVAAVQRDALAELEVEPRGQGRRGLVRAHQGGQAHAAVHGARVQVGEPEPGGDAPRDRGLPRPGGPVDGNDHGESD